MPSTLQCHHRDEVNMWGTGSLMGCETASAEACYALCACCPHPSSCASCSVVNLAKACLLVPTAASVALVTAYRCFRSLSAHKRWTQRRRRLFGLYATQVRACVCLMSDATYGMRVTVRGGLSMCARPEAGPAKRLSDTLCLLTWSNTMWRLPHTLTPF